MDPSMNNWPPSAHNQQGSSSSPYTSQIISQLHQLYALLQECYPDWCRENSFLSLVQESSYAELTELYITWIQHVKFYQAQLRAGFPVGDAIGQQPDTRYIDQASNHNPETHQAFESTTYDDLNGGTQAFPEVENRGQAASPMHFDTRSDDQMIYHDQVTPVPIRQASLPLTTTLVEANTDNSATGLPDWLFLVRPQPEGQVVVVRRECQVALDIKLMELPELPGRLPVKWKGLVIPSTANVRTEDYWAEETVLHLSVRVLGANTKREYKAVCGTCSKREGKKKGKPSLVDFVAASNVIKAPEDGPVQVKFKFSCYPKHQDPNECAYLLEVALLEKKLPGQLVPSQRAVATCRLPWYFKVGRRQADQSVPAASADGSMVPQNGADNSCGPRLLTGDAPPSRACVRAEPRVTQESMILPSPAPFSLSEGEHQAVSYVPHSSPQAPAARRQGADVVAGPLRRKRGRGEADLDDTDSRSAAGGRHVRPRCEQRDGTTSTEGPSASVNNSDSRPFNMAAGTGAAQRATQHRVPSSDGPSSSPAMSATHSAPQLEAPNMGLDASLRRIQRQNNSSRPVEPITTRSGPVSGGIEICLAGEDLTMFSLRAGFGTQVTTITVQNAATLSCILPSASHLGPVKVTLSRSAYPGAPQYGMGLAEFAYHSDHAPLIPLLSRMEEKGRPEYTPTIQAILRMLQGDHAPQGSGNSQDGQIESSLINALLSLREKPNFNDIVSTSNDSSQTLAHISVLCGYISLLRHLVDWRIDLTTADTSGLTALHCAYLKEDRESIRILLRGGASPFVKDKLGRIPRDLAPEGSDLADGLEGEIGTRGSPPIEHPMDQEIALGEQFTVLEAEEEHEIDSGHGGSESESESESDAPSNNDSGEEGMGISSPTLGAGPSMSTLDVMNQLLISKKARRKRGARLIPDTPHDPAISTVSKKLRDTEADLAAIEYLCGAFLGGIITLEALREPITQRDAMQFQVEEGNQKYRGLLSREREMFNCRLCPEDNKLDFKDPEEALHHMTKDHLDMGYSCRCGCTQVYWTSRDLKRHQKTTGIKRSQVTAII